VSNEDVEVSVELSYFVDVDDAVEYSFEFVISSIVVSMFVLVVLEISSVVSDINCVAGSANMLDEIRTVSEFGLVLNVDVVELLSNVAMDAVDNSFIYPTEESVWCNDVSEMDAKAVEVGTNDVSNNNSVFVVLKIFIVVPVVGIVCKEDDNGCPVKLEIVLVVVVVPISGKNVVLVSDNDRLVAISEFIIEIDSVSEV